MVWPLKIPLISYSYHTTTINSCRADYYHPWTFIQPVTKCRDLAAFAEISCEYLIPSPRQRRSLGMRPPHPGPPPEPSGPAVSGAMRFRRPRGEGRARWAVTFSGTKGNVPWSWP